MILTTRNAIGWAAIRKSNGTRIVARGKTRAEAVAALNDTFPNVAGMICSAYNLRIIETQSPIIAARRFAG